MELVNFIIQLWGLQCINIAQCMQSYLLMLWPDSSKERSFIATLNPNQSVGTSLHTVKPLPYVEFLLLQFCKLLSLLVLVLLLHTLVNPVQILFFVLFALWIQYSYYLN